MTSRYHRSAGNGLARIAALLAATAIIPTTSLHAQCDPSTNENIGCFTSVTPTGQTQLLVYPTATHTFQLIAKSNLTRYTSNNALIGTNNDFTGYVGRHIGGGLRSSNDGWLSINHETDPGGVSMLKIHLDGSDALWKTTYVKKVDYTPVVKSTRNCSGTVTPWGTIISSEETTNAGDANSDGYQDVGWNTEIDPESGQIIDHDGDGKPDKLWAMGRISHENVVVASDRITVYQAEDGGSGCVFKFVANTAGDLSSGTLYALKRNASPNTTGTWVQVANTTQTQRNTTGSLATAAGGTNWGGVEDVEIGPDGKVYFAVKNNNTNGGIWRFTDNGTTVSNIELWVGPPSSVFPIVTASGTVNEQWRDGIDNLAFDGEGNLWGLQDGGRNHIWVIRPDHTPAVPHVELFATTPLGCEPTGITFSPDYRYLFISMQEPNSSNTQSQTDVAGNSVVWNASTTIVIARKEFLGPLFINDTRLPVELSGFNVSEHDGIVSLAWQTASEVDNAGFEVERANGTEGDFQRIVSYVNDPSLTGLGNSSSGKSYRYVDNNGQNGLTPGTYRYRLVDVASDGIRTPHEARTVVIEDNTTTVMTGSFNVGNVMPNPTSHRLIIPLHIAEKTSVTIEIYDAAGKRISVVKQDETYDIGNHQIDVSVETLIPGKYFVKTTTPSASRTREFVVAR